MFSRRTMLRTGATTAISLAGLRQISVLADDDDTTLEDTLDLGILFHQNLPVLPEAAPGEIEVVLVGYADSRNVGLLIHNASDETVGLENAPGIARGTDGTETETVLRASFAPYVLEPGGFAIGVAMLEESLNADEEYEFEFEVKTEEPGSGFVTRIDIPVTELEVDRNQVSGSVENTSEHVASDLVGVRALFFDDDGNVVGWFETYLSTSVDPGETGRYTNGHVIGEATDSWLLAASGQLR